MVAHSGEPIGRRLFAPLLILLALILLGYTLRVHNLDAFSFWTDEGLTPERSGYPIAQILRNDILIQGVVTKDTHPPLYYLIIHVTRQLFGLSDFAFRYPSVLFGVLLIPLIYQLGRRMGTVALGLLVALLAAVNPLQVYYSQEARMYTLLVLLVTGMSYVLWRALSHPALSRRLLWRYLLLYGLLAGLAFYTHYTVVFLAAAQALFWAWLLWREGLKWVILGAIGVAALVAVPLIPYTVPRLLAGTEANYFYVPPLTMLLDVIRFFNLGLTVDFDQAVVVALNLLALGLLVLGLWAARPWPKRLFLLTWLLAVVVGLMAGSVLFKPMYQGVRHIMAGSPAFLLLLAYGLTVILQIRDTRYEIRVKRRSSELVFRISYLVSLLLLAGSALALYNLYFDPAYAKDDFRAIVRFIETRAGDRDVIVYNNAVLLPLHEHYRLRPDIAVTALPVYPQFATGQEPELAQLAHDYDRVWFITDPPADKRDEGELIRGWLDANLMEVSNRLFPARTTQARVIGYATAADDQPPATVNARWDEFPALSGVRIGGPQPLALPTLWVDLFWQGQQPSGEGRLLFTLIGPDDAEWYSRSHPLSRDGQPPWDAAAPNRRSYDLPLPPGLPPGSYSLAVGPEGQAQEHLAQVEIASTDAWPVTPEALFGRAELAAVDGRSPAVSWPNGLALAAVEPWDDGVLPGNNLPLTLHWRVGAAGIDLTDLRYRLEVISSDGNVLRSQEARPGAPWLGRVAPGALLREVTSLYFRPETQPGDYRLRWTLLNGDTPVADPVEHTRLTVEPWPLVTELPAAENIIEADFGPAIRLFGFDLGQAVAGALPLTLYWQTQEQPGDYLIFIHLVDNAGQIVSQIDAIPVGGARPTSGWRAGEVITDVHNLSIPADLPPGRYHLNVGLYNPDDGTRPAVSRNGEPQPDNQLRLTTLEWPEEAE
jgi:uncharacterized membrane protein